MTPIAYFDFDLVIETFGDGYRAKVIDSPAGQATHSFRFPVDDWELETFLVWLGSAPYRTRRVESKEMRAAKQLGARLFQVVFGGEVGICWQRSLDECQRHDTGLRIRLRLSGAPELSELPWEFLYDQASNQFLALSSKTPIVRYIDLPQSTRPVTVKPPLRVLVMVSNPLDWDTLDVDEERNRLKDALADSVKRGHVILDFLPEATLEALQHRLRQNTYHLFHFIGHGGFDQDRRDGILIFRDEHGRGQRVTSQHLSTILTDHSALRLVILNACEGARGAREDPFTGVAQTLVQRGIPAVIAMQYQVVDQAAIAFSQEFYAALVDKYPVDAAVSEARKTVFTQGSDIGWGVPVIYMRAPDGHLFDFETLVSIQAPERVVRATSFAIATFFICALLLLGILLSNFRALNNLALAIRSPEHSSLAAVATPSPTFTATFTATQTPTDTATVTHTATPTPTDTATVTHTATLSPTNTATNTLTHTATATKTSTKTAIPTDEATSLPSPTLAPTEVPLTSTTVAVPSTTSSPTVAPTDTPTATPTAIATDTPTDTPTATPTATATFTPTLTFTATRRPNTRTPTPTATATLVPGVYVTRFDVSPENPLRNQQIQFTATLLNATNSRQKYRVRFQLYANETRKRYTDTPIQQVELAARVGTFTLSQSWVYDSALTGCVSFYVRLEYQTDSARIPFTDTNGVIRSETFVVCAPER